MKKNGRIQSLMESLGTAGHASPTEKINRFYLAYFQLFNAQRYFDAHDVLEHLWLSRRDRTQGKDPDSDYFKGLIQVAGAFVHLQKHFLRPNHPKDAGRLRPAVRLFDLALRNIVPYGPVHIFLDVEALNRLCTAQIDRIIGSGYTINPWTPESSPVLTLQAIPLNRNG